MISPLGVLSVAFLALCVLITIYIFYFEQEYLICDIELSNVKVWAQDLLKCDSFLNSLLTLCFNKKYVLFMSNICVPPPTMKDISPSSAFNERQ